MNKLCIFNFLNFYQSYMGTYLVKQFYKVQAHILRSQTHILVKFYMTFQEKDSCLRPLISISPSKQQF